MNTLFMTLAKLLGRTLLALVVIAALLLSPVVWVEVACRGTAVAQAYEALLPEADHRAESRTLLTYPEWHIVYAYDDYAKLIATNDPHEFGFLRAIAGFWRAVCPLNERAAQHGGATTETKLTIYTIGVSFTVEMLLKAAYEETAGRIATWMRGDNHAPLDDLSARQAAAYAQFLQQVPWYKWDFTGDSAALADAATDALRDRERLFALGTEYWAKAAYAKVIEQAVAQVGADALTIRSIVTDITPEALRGFEEIEVIETRPEGIEIETPRYRTFTYILADLANQGATIVEIAGNDDILVTVITRSPLPDAVHSFTRQGYGDTRNLMLVKVSDLADRLRAIQTGDQTLEHIHDY